MRSGSATSNRKAKVTKADIVAEWSRRRKLTLNASKCEVARYHFLEKCSPNTSNMLLGTQGTMGGVTRRQTGTHGPSTAEKYLQTIHLLAGQLTVYTDGSATAATKQGGAEVIVTCGDQADPTILHRSHLRGATFTSSFAEEAAAMQLALEWATANQPENSFTICTDRQSLLKAIESNPWQRTRRYRSSNSHFNHLQPSYASAGHL